MSDSSNPAKKVAATKKVAAKRTPRTRAPALKPEETPRPILIDGAFCEPVWLTRFLYADGTVEDIVTTTDDSRLRGALLDARKLKDDRIVGSARVSFLGYSNPRQLLDLEADMEEGA